MKIWTILPGQLYQSARTVSTKQPRKLEILQQHGIKVVLALCNGVDEELRGHVVYYYQPIADGHIQDEQLLEDLTTVIVEEIRYGSPALVHCRGGRNRSGLLSAMIVRRLRGVTGAEAFDIVRRGRPGSLVNPHFEQYLKGLAAP